MDADFVLRAFDWSSLGDATVVDVGSSPILNKVYHGISTDIAYFAICCDRWEAAVVTSVGPLQRDFQISTSSSRITQRRSSQARKRCHWT